MFYKDVAPVDAQKHADLKLSLADNFAFAAKVHAVPVVGGEFSSLMREYPIVFAQTGEDSYAPTVMLGLKAEQNLFVDADGKWDAQYIPFFVRRYPFVTVEVENNDAVLCVETGAIDGVRREGDANAFENGQPTEAMKNFAQLMFQSRDDANRSTEFAAELAKLGLLRQVSATAELPSGEKLSMDGMWVVDEEKLRALPAGKADEWLKNGLLSVVYAHLFSLSNLQGLVERVQKRAAN
ncbi:SapC family protein [Chitinimonas koreensis]|uniref:SapC family protein n=1 Tax=Chitinimonas koreensis TaxID=356302 RepID=UPI0003FC0DB1|nr:SapC family protein [Chitinimonas koreensis]QNM97315.1 SapC family protein [Chitinimonas koreensis]